VHGEDIALADASEAAFNERMPRPGRRPGRPRDTNSDETRWRILEAAIDAFAERGYDGVSTREIARHAEVTSATVYHHFPSKFALYQDAYQFAIEVAFGAYSRAVAGRESVLAELDAVLECSLGLMRERLAITSLAIHAQTDAVHPEMQNPELHESGRAFFDGMVNRAIARGELAADDAVLFERMLVVFLWGLSMVGLTGPTERVECVDALKRLLTGTLLRPAR